MSAEKKLVLISAGEYSDYEVYALLWLPPGADMGALWAAFLATPHPDPREAEWELNSDRIKRFSAWLVSTGRADPADCEEFRWEGYTYEPGMWKAEGQIGTEQ